MQMVSGVTFDKDHLGFWNDINNMEHILALGRSMDGFTGKLIETEAIPGQCWKYVSIDIRVLGMVLRGASGRNIPDLMQEKLLDHMGFETDPYYLSDGFETAFVPRGRNLTTRDNARFGQMIVQGGQWQVRQIVPDRWIAASDRALGRDRTERTAIRHAMANAPDAGEDEFLARGIYWPVYLC